MRFFFPQIKIVFVRLRKKDSRLIIELLVEPITRLLVGPRQAEDYVTVDELREIWPVLSDEERFEGFRLFKLVQSSLRIRLLSTL